MAKAVKKTNTQKRSGGSSGRKTGGSSSGARKKRKPDKRTIEKKKKKLRSEVAVIITAFLGMFFLLSNFGLFGAAGAAVSAFQKGLFGIAAYVLPLLLIAAVWLYVSNMGHFMAPLKLMCSLLSIFMLSGVFELLFGEERGLAFFAHYESSAAGRLGGGAVGGAIADTLTAFCGTIGAYLILILIFILCMVVITEKSFVGAARQGAERTMSAARAGKERYEAIHEERRIRKQARREAEKLRKKELSFPDVRNRDTEVMADKAGVYASYGRDIIEGEVGQSVAEEPAPKAPIYYDYGADTVPFEEDHKERYKSYAHILDEGQGPEIHIAEGQELDLDEARSFGYAVGQGSASERLSFEPEPVSAFRTADDYALDMDEAHEPDIHQTQIHDESMGMTFDEGLEEDMTDGSETMSREPLGPETFAHETSADSPALEAGADQEVVTSAFGKELEPVSRYERDRIIKEKFPDAQASARTQGHAGVESAPAGQTAAHQTAAQAHQSTAQDAAAQIKKETQKPRKPYRFPPLSLLDQGKKPAVSDRSELRETALKLEHMLKTFGVGVKVTNVTKGPSVTRYELVPDTGVSVSKITSRSDDIKLALAASELRIEAPIPGKAAVGIEVANKESSTVYLRDILSSQEFKNAKSKLSFAIGRDIQGQTIIGNIAKMPHLLIAGATGSGKSVGINSLIMSLIYKSSPDEVRLIMIDPKVVELSPYNGIPHLLIPVVTEPKKALSTLNWAVAEMTDRYKKFEETGTKTLETYNEKVELAIRQLKEAGMEDKAEALPQKLPQIVIIIDELAELMMSASKEVNPKDVESAIARLTQLARAAGMHLVIATQRPSVNVVTGLIKANIPSRIAFRTSSSIDSRTILDCAGAENLIGQGDMLFLPPGSNQLIRIQGAYVSEAEIEKVVSFVSKGNPASYEESVETGIANQQKLDFSGGEASVVPGDDRDSLFLEAGDLIVDTGKASIGMLQRRFKIGFNRAARIMDQLCEAGVVGEEEGTKPRRILMDKGQYAQFKENGGH